MNFRTKMKRDRGVDRVRDEEGSSAMASSPSTRKLHEQPDAGVDELLAVLGYKVRSSDMAEVAHKLHHLQRIMDDDDYDTALKPGLSRLGATDTVHSNPSDLSAWVQTMLSELNAGFDVFQTHPHSDFCNPIQLQGNPIFDDNSEYDLRAIPGEALCNHTETESKRMKLSSSNHLDHGLVKPPTTLLVDSQEAGVRLVHTLMACADAIQHDNLKLADALMNPIGILAVSQTGSMRKVATYFAEALARRIYKICPREAAIETSCADMLQMHFYETCPYLKFAHFTANQAILEAFAESDRVHVIDFSLKHGMQWPALMQALALRDGGPPTFRLTGIGSPQPDNADALEQVGSKLAQLAETIGIQFEFNRFFANSLADLEASMLDVRPSESVAVNSVLELHRLLDSPSAVEKVLSFVKAMKPKIVTIVEEEANHNGASFTDRFNEALHYYSTMFDSLESSALSQPTKNEDDVLMSELYLGRQICNVVACEGAERVERHEPLSRWRARMKTAGFQPAHLGSNAFKQASMLLALFGGGDGYSVEETDGCLTLGWHTRPLIATSAWQVATAW